MQGYLRYPWPEDAVGNKVAVIMFIKKDEKEAYQTASSRSDYFHSITRTVTLFQRKLFRERTRIMEENPHGFPDWLNIPNVPPPLPLGEKDF